MKQLARANRGSNGYPFSQIKPTVQGTEDAVVKPVCVRAEPLQSCPTLQITDCSLPVSSVHGILQAKIREWVAMPSSKGSFQPRD